MKRKGWWEMMNFILPFTYALFTTYSILKNQVFFLGINTLTIILYIANVLATYILYKIGGMIDRCLERFY